MNGTSRLRPTEAAWDFLSDLYRNPDLARELLEEIVAGTFVELDGRPCLEEMPAAPQSTGEQMRLGE